MALTHVYTYHQYISYYFMCHMYFITVATHAVSCFGESIQDVLCCRDYSEQVVNSFTQQIQSEYCGRNRYVSIEGI